MKITVSVTADDIREGGHACSFCPIHRAVVRATGRPPESVNVYSKGASLGGIVYFFNDKVLEWLYAYDIGRGGQTQPITFELEVP